MKKNLFASMLVIALVLCLSFGAFAVPTTNTDKNDPNQYNITDNLKNYSNEKLFIGTLADWKTKSGDTSKTFFQNGEAIHNNDIIITNGVVGAALAVGTRNPWGYPGGSILDAGNVTSGNTITATKGKRDTVWSIELLINGWDAWSPNNCGIVTFDVVKYDFTTKAESATGLDAIKVSRIYDLDGNKFDVVTYYGIAEGANTIFMYDQVTNTAGKDISKQSTRFAMTNKGDDGGAMLTMPDSKVIGCYGNVSTEGKAPYAITYTLPGKNTSNLQIDHPWTATGGSVGYKELRSNMEYKKGEIVTFEEFITISDEPTTEAFDTVKMGYDKAETTAISGTLLENDGATPLADGFFVVNKIVDGKEQLYGWYKADDKGVFAINLPKNGEFKLHVESNGYANGAAVEVKSDAAKADVKLVAGKAKEEISFTLKDKKGNPVWGKLELFDENGKSVYPTVRFAGDSVYQADDTKNKGVIKADIAPGKYKAVVYGEGYWFYSKPVVVEGDTETKTVDVTVDMKYAPKTSWNEGQWLSGDFHHHANKNDAFSDPKDAVPSLAAAGIDVGFVTDHDFTVNNKKAYDLSDDYGLKAFVPSEEISAAWAHFNAIPLNENAYTDLLDENSDNSDIISPFLLFPDILAEGVEKDYSITANHPWQSYGVFYSDNIGAVPGGYADGYDNIEINACVPDSENIEVIKSAMDLWTSYADGTALYKDINGEPVYTKKPHYIVGGSDTHDVLYPGFADEKYNNSRSEGAYASGKVRTFGYVSDMQYENSIRYNGLQYVYNILDGRSYTTFGPLLDFSIMPGTQYDRVDSIMRGYDNENVTKVDEDGYFRVDVDIQSLAKVKDVLVLTKYGKDEYTGIDAGLYTEQPLQYDKSASKLNVNKNELKAKIKVKVPARADSWVAVFVIDENGNYAISNPWWLSNNAGFPDVVKDSWYEPYVNALAKDGIINGYPDGTFKPNVNVTRAEFAQMLAGWAPKAAKKADTTFTDVKKGDWFYNSVMVLAENGYAVGYNGEFRPNEYITRAEVAQMLYKVSGLEKSDKASFKDVDDKAWYAEAVNALAAAEYVAGYPDGTFKPQNNTIRSEAATFIYITKNDGKVILSNN